MERIFAFYLNEQVFFVDFFSYIICKSFIVSDYNAEEKFKAKAEKRKPFYLPHFSAHSCRHTFCTRLCECEHNIAVIQKIMGHKDIKMTMEIYNKVSERLKQESFDDLASKLF